MFASWYEQPDMDQILIFVHLFALLEYTLRCRWWAWGTFIVSSWKPYSNVCIMTRMDIVDLGFCPPLCYVLVCYYYYALSRRRRRRVLHTQTQLYVCYSSLFSCPSYSCQPLLLTNHTQKQLNHKNTSLTNKEAEAIRHWIPSPPFPSRQ